VFVVAFESADCSVEGWSRRPVEFGGEGSGPPRLRYVWSQSKVPTVIRGSLGDRLGWGEGSGPPRLRMGCLIEAEREG
jgi:hypothetical protein